MPATMVLPIHLEVDGVPCEVLSVHGVERLSTPWRFDVQFSHEGAALDLEGILTKPAALSIRAPLDHSGAPQYRVAAYRGCIATIRQMETPTLDPKAATRYEAVLVPNLWKLSLTTQTRIFLDMPVKEMVEKVLKENGFASSDFDFAPSPGPKREFIAQYQETDLDFVERWLEHEGIGYCFRDTDQGEQIVFFDSTAGYNPITGEAKIDYDPADIHGKQLAAVGANAWADENVQRFIAEVNVLPSKVVLRDYNWRKPSDDIKVEEQAVKDGQGWTYFYGEHYKDKGEGASIAKARAQEIQSRHKVFRGTSNHKSFRPGHKFTLKKHPRPDFNAEYVLTQVTHSATQPGAVELKMAAGTQYSNEFEAIPAAQTFRPPREVEWPSIHGFMHGKVDAGGDGQYAEIDDMGRYKVMLPFDLSGRSGGKASRYVRMMQPYAGGGMGMHFPLHKGTEVLLAFLDGDPDRPVIIGSIPNPETASPVTGSNQTQCKILTGGGNSMTIEDTDGSQRILMHSPTKNTFVSLGAPPA